MSRGPSLTQPLAEISDDEIAREVAQSQYTPLRVSARRRCAPAWDGRVWLTPLSTDPQVLRRGDSERKAA